MLKMGTNDEQAQQPVVVSSSAKNDERDNALSDGELSDDSGEVCYFYLITV